MDCLIAWYETGGCYACTREAGHDGPCAAVPVTATPLTIVPTPSTDDAEYSNIRDQGLLGPVLGQRVLEVTQHDKSEWEENGESRIYFHFENGYTVSFPIEDAGFVITPP